jgi:hypothetical protein
LIEPKCDDTSLFFSNVFSFKNRHDVCEHAYQATRRHLLARADEIVPKLERNGLRLRVDILKEESRHLFDDRGVPLPYENGEAGSSARAVLAETDAVLDRLDAMLERIERHAA